MDNTASEQVTRILGEAAGGERHAAKKLLPLVYEQLKELARCRMVGERRDHTLQATALVHEAYLRLVGNCDMPWTGKTEFFSAAAEAMRRILIDHARARGGKKRGGGRREIPLNVLDLAAPEQFEEILALDEAVSRLEKVSADLAEVVRVLDAGATEAGRPYFVMELVKGIPITEVGSKFSNFGTGIKVQHPGATYGELQNIR